MSKQIIALLAAGLLTLARVAPDKEENVIVHLHLGISTKAKQGENLLASRFHSYNQWEKDDANGS